ncbi:FadR/GntR family transcriptional regulator [Marasmitruncus massiliensis]|uniref:FadR/GntR family transcriptional regulator n=1 Tax=Marasmitruncus massiliensis TaxID=1944642 RepID=UPI000C79D669|nr:FadR/GntR family transcriptional regulator [Marasmitruncus massiliensis]MBE6906038.1 FadR family transcriptional regulator [Oscillospiraceae bacterium]
MFEVIFDNGKPLTERVSSQIIQMVQESQLKPGDKLPNEFDLAQRLNVGRGTVREAVKLLVSRNVLEIRRGKGTFVTERVGVSDDPLGLTFIRDKHKLATDMQDIRVMIEPQIAAMAAARATLDDVAEMRRLCAEIERLAPLGEDYQEYDVELHTCIARSTKNIVVPNLIPIINKGIALFMDLSNRIYWPDTLKHHREVVDAIERHDPDAARSAMLCHTMLNRQCMESIQKKMQSAQ